MNMLATLFAVAVSSMTPIKSSPNNACVVQLMSHPGCAAEQRLSWSQKRQINRIRQQTNRKVASLKVQLRRVDYMLASARSHRISPLKLRQLHVRKAVLLGAINRQKVQAVSRINAVLTRYQKAQCFAGHVPTKRQGKWTPNKATVKVTITRSSKHKVERQPMPGPRHGSRYAPPSKYKTQPAAPKVPTRRSQRSKAGRDSATRL